MPVFTITGPPGASTFHYPALVVAPTPPVVVDACGNTLTAVPGAAPTAPTCEGDMVYTFTYTDGAGNTATWTYTYTLEMPVFTINDAPPASTLDCPAETGAPAPQVL